MERRLYDAAVEGDLESLHQLLSQDPLLLERYNAIGHFSRSPLHVAAQLGHVHFVHELLRHSPELAEEVDLQKQTPLHVASSRGHIEVVKALVTVAPIMCHACDQEGRNPIDVTDIKGKVGVLEELMRARPLAVEDKVEGTNETVLHLCVKYGQSEALKMIVDFVSHLDSRFLNSKDAQGNTIVHFAVAEKQVMIMDFLITNPKVDLNVINANGLTALDLPATQTQGETKSMIKSLKYAGAQKAKHIPSHVGKEWVDEQRQAIMVVASVIATMAFQAALTPPGDVWHENKTSNEAGTSIMAHQDLDDFKCYLFANTLSFISSLSTILLLVSGLPCHRLFVAALMVGI